MLDADDKAWLDSLVQSRLNQRLPILIAAHVPAAAKEGVWDGTLWAGDTAPAAKVAFQRLYTWASSIPGVVTALAQNTDDVDENQIAQMVLQGLGGIGLSDEDMATALRAALGDRAAAVGVLLAN